MHLGNSSHGAGMKAPRTTNAVRSSTRSSAHLYGSASSEALPQHTVKTCKFRKRKTRPIQIEGIVIRRSEKRARRWSVVDVPQGNVTAFSIFWGERPARVSLYPKIPGAPRAMEVTEALGAQRMVLEFYHSVSREFLPKDLWGIPGYVLPSNPTTH